MLDNPELWIQSSSNRTNVTENSDLNASDLNASDLNTGEQACPTINESSHLANTRRTRNVEA